MDVRMKINGDIIEVIAPYDPAYPRAARQKGGEWDKSGECWTFPVKAENAVEILNYEIYGAKGNERDVVEARVTFHDGFVADKGPVVWCGCLLANARGRDSGATCGEVIYEEGGCSSGGSAKNWDSRVTAGSVVLLDAPRTALEAQAEMPGVSVEILGGRSAAIIEAEIEELEARLKALRAELATT